MKLIALALAVALTNPAAAEQHDRDDQWLYRDSIYDSGPAVAVFLSWNYSAVLLRAYCDPQASELVVEYHPDPSSEGSIEPMVLFLGDQQFPMRTHWDRNGRSSQGESLPPKTEPLPMVGRLPVSQALLEAWPSEPAVDIWTPIDMDEPWYTGRAEPLQRIIQDCLKAP